MKGRMMPLCYFDHIIILAIINIETTCCHIIQYKFGSDEGWANNCFSIAISKAHEIDFVLASCQLRKDR